MISLVVGVATRDGKWQKMCQEVKGTSVGNRTPSASSSADGVWRAVGEPPSEVPVLDISFVPTNSKTNLGGVANSSVASH